MKSKEATLELRAEDRVTVIKVTEEEPLGSSPGTKSRWQERAWRAQASERRTVGLKLGMW